MKSDVNDRAGNVTALTTSFEDAVRYAIHIHAGQTRAYLVALAVFTVDVYLGCLIVLFVVYPLLARAHGLKPSRFFAGAWPAISFAFVSRAPMDKLQAYRRRMGWEIPWYSSFGSDFNPDFGVGPVEPQEGTYQDGESFGLSVFIRDGDEVFRTYFTSRRGAETLGPVWTFLDLTPLGRQEEWEDSPPGYPQTPPYDWWRRHDEYE